MSKEDTGRLFAKAPPFPLPKPKRLPVGPITFVIGPPGSGKGTLCSRICAGFPGLFKHLSVGDFLREKFCTNSSGGVPSASSAPAPEPGCLPRDEIAKYVREGRLLPPETIIPLIKAELLAGNISPGTWWLIDGFPRDLDTAIAFEEEIGNPTSVFKLTCDDSICRQRFVARQRSSSDNDECFERRLNEYNENSEPISNYYTDIIGPLTYVNSGEDDWISKMVESFKPDDIGLDRNASRGKQ